jgi:hypothetical protein
MTRKAKLFEAAFAAVLRFGRINPYWAKRAQIEIKWRGRYFEARCFFVDPYSGSRVTFAVIPEYRLWPEIGGKAN